MSASTTVTFKFAVEIWPFMLLPWLRRNWPYEAPVEASINVTFELVVEASTRVPFKLSAQTADLSSSKVTLKLPVQSGCFCSHSGYVHIGSLDRPLRLVPRLC